MGLYGIVISNALYQRRCTMRKTGTYERLGSINYFIPDALPPKEPPLVVHEHISILYGEAMHELGKLNEMAHRLPDAHRFIKAYIIKEALLTSAIEGVHTTLIEMFTQPLLSSKPEKDLQLVMNYTKALDAVLSMIRTEGLPIVTQVMCKAHEILMQYGAGDKSDPGNLRRQSVMVGNLVPPPAIKIPDLMSDLEQYINLDETAPPLIKAGLAHVQFETIHPFLDGNGRIGRLLIVLMLIDSGLLLEPILYPSYYFKKHHFDYYHALDRVRTHGDFEGWITFYLHAIKETSIDAYRRAKDIEQLTQSLTAKITDNSWPQNKKDSRLLALSLLFSYPVIDVSTLSNQLKIAYNTARSIIDDFIDLDILVAHPEQLRGQLFRFAAYLEALELEYNDI